MHEPWEPGGELGVARGVEVPEASPRGTYLVISEALRQKIESGAFDDRLPSEADLMNAYGVAMNTVRRALKALAAEGVLESAPGVGWRVARNGDARTLVERMTDVIAEDSLSIGMRTRLKPSSVIALKSPGRPCAVRSPRWKEPACSTPSTARDARYALCQHVLGSLSLGGHGTD